MKNELLKCNSMNSTIKMIYWLVYSHYGNDHYDKTIIGICTTHEQALELQTKMSSNKSYGNRMFYYYVTRVSSDEDGKVMTETLDMA